MKNFIKQFSLLLLIIFSFVFVSCESNEDTQLVEEQNDEFLINRAPDGYKTVNLPDGRSINYPYWRVTIKANYNSRYLNSKNGTSAMRFDATVAGSYETFSLIQYPNISQNRYILQGNNASYVRIRGVYNKLYCNEGNADHATKFSLNGDGNDDMGLNRGVPGYAPIYLSCENPKKDARWNRSWKRSLESFQLAFYAP